MKYTWKRFLSFMLALLMVISVLPISALAAQTFTATVLDGKITVAGDGNTSVAGGSEKDGVITITAKATANCAGVDGYTYTANTHTVTVTNSTTDETLMVEFAFTVPEMGSLKIDSAAKTSAGNYSKSLAPGEKITIELTSPASGNTGTPNSAEITLSNFALKDTSAKSVTVNPATGGTTKVNGTAITAATTVSTDYATGVTVAATASSGYKFIAWLDGNGNVLSTLPTDTIHPLADMTVTAQFVSNNNTGYWLAGGKVHTDLNNAITAAQNGDKKIVLLTNATLAAGTYTIPTDVSLLIPKDSALTSYGDDPALAANGAKWVTPTAYVTLTLASGANLVVNGTMELAAMHYIATGISTNDQYRHGGAINGSYGHVATKDGSKITVNGTLYAWGIVSGSGEVIANSGSNVYEKMQITDYRGGGATSAVVSQTSKKTFPFNQYYVQNIEVKETIHYGATVWIHAGVYASGPESSSVAFVGTGTSAMFGLEPSAYIVKDYNETADRLEIDLHGSGSLNPITLTFSGQAVNSSSFRLGINNNIDIRVHSGVIKITQDIVLQPGATVSIDREATLYVPGGISLFVLDQEDWGPYARDSLIVPVYWSYANGRTYVRSASTVDDLTDAIVDVNGTVIVGGAIYTSGSQSVISSEKTGVYALTTSAPSNTTVYQVTGVDTLSIYGSGAWSSFTVTPTDLVNGDASVTGTSSGSPYDAFIYDSFLDKWVQQNIYNGGAGYTATLTYDANGGEGTAPNTIMDYFAQAAAFMSSGYTTMTPYSFAVADGSVLTRTNYKFVGWSTDPEATEAEYTGGEYVTISADTTLYAVWRQTEATITYNANPVEGATVTGDSTKTVGLELPDSGKASITLADNSTFIVNGYTFVEWNTKADGTGTAYAAGANIEVTGDITLYAQWTQSTYTITFIANAPEGIDATGTMEDIVVYTDGEGKSEFEVPECDFKVEGHSFDGWTDIDGNPYTVGEHYDITGDITLYAQWTKSTYTITFNANAPKETTATGTMTAQTVVAGDKLKTNTFKAEGYTFKGWNAAADGSGTSYADGAVAPEANTTLYAQWEKNIYTITWLVDGMPVATTYVEHGETPVYPNGTPTKDTEDGVKYTFTGWSPALAPATEDMEYDAVFSKSTVEYDISWDTDGDGDVDKITAVEHGTVPTAPDFSLADTAEWNYTFTGWRDSDGKEYTNATLPAAYGDTTYTAVYNSEKQTYTISWDTDGDGDVDDTTTVPYGTVPTHADGTKAETAEYTYTFSGWSPAVSAVTGEATYTAQFSQEAKTYTITWNVDGTKTTQGVKYGTVITLPTEPSKTGYSFTGWEGYTDGMTMPAKDVEFTATWNINVYTITWIVEGVSTTTTVKHGETPAFDGTPAKEATAQFTYTFAGWTPKVVTATGDATYTAQFTSALRSYDITFMVDGAEYKKVPTNYGETPVVENPSKATDAYYSYTFKGWAAEADGTVLESLPAVTGTATYYAVFEKTPVDHTITFVIDGEEGIFYQVSGGYDTEVDYTDMPSTDKTGYTFSGWDMDLPETFPAEDIVITGSYTINQYTITYMNGNDVVKEIKADYNTALDQAEIPADLEQEGYTFRGWSAELPATMPAENMVIYAQWDANEYTISFYTEKDAETAYATITADTDTDLAEELGKIQDPIKAGYTFAGWVDEDGYSVDLKTMPAGGMNVYAKWTTNEYTISFYANEGDTTAYASFDVPYGTELTEDYVASLLAQITAPTKEGHTWKGWDTSSVPVTMPAEAVSICGTWTVNTYTVYWVIDGVPYTTTSVAFGEAINEPTKPTKEGHTFSGWSDIPQGMPAEDVTINGSWIVNQYTITFDVEGIAPITADYGAEINWPEDPTKTGYTFQGWSTDGENVITLPETMPVDGLNLKAVWVRNTIYITWIIDGVKTVVPYGYDDPITAPEATKAADAYWTYKFVGWQDAEGNEVTIPDTATANATYTAQFAQHEAVKYTVKFVDAEDANTVYYQTEIAWNGEVTLVGFTAPTKEGHSLTWTVNGDEVNFPYDMITEAVTFVAQWTPNTYTITADGVKYSFTYGTAVSISDPTKEGHTFNGWRKDGVAYTLPATMPAEDIVITSDWTVNTYTLTVSSYDENGEYFEETITVPYGAKLSDYYLETPSYTDPYIGWYMEFEAWFVWTWENNDDSTMVEYTGDTMPASDVKMYTTYVFTGWYERVDGFTSYAVKSDLAYYRDEWATIDGAQYYFVYVVQWFEGMDFSYSYIVKDITLIDGKYYAFDHESGKFLSDLTGIYTASNGDLYYVENGVAVANKGMVQVDDPAVEGGHLYYYFGCGMDNCDSDTCSGEYMAQRSGSHWAEITNGYLVLWGYTFDENGVIIHDEDTSKNGVHKDNGVKYYYIDGVKVHYGLFIGADGEYYYARSDGSLVVSRDYWISASHLNGVERNGEPVAEGTYTFDSEGRIVWPGETKNGIYAEDGSLYYYVDGVRNYAGLIIIDGDYYYVRGTGEVVNGTRYWITKTNDLKDQGSYEFDEEGKMILTNGFVDVDGTTYYYKDGQPFHAGLILVDGDYYYVKSSGEVVKNCTYWVSYPNGYMDEGSYEFDADGKMIIPEPVPNKNGIVEENGSLYYYVNGKLTYAGLIQYTGTLTREDGTEVTYDNAWIYVRGTGEVVHSRYYWITMTNDWMNQGGYTFDEDGKMIMD